MVHAPGSVDNEDVPTIRLVDGKELPLDSGARSVPYTGPGATADSAAGSAPFSRPSLRTHAPARSPHLRHQIGGRQRNLAEIRDSNVGKLRHRH